MLKTITLTKSPKAVKGFALTFKDSEGLELPSGSTENLAVDAPPHSTITVSVTWTPNDEFGTKGVREVFLFKFVSPSSPTSGGGRIQLTVSGKARESVNNGVKQKVRS